jgi:hypothetical protein
MALRDRLRDLIPALPWRRDIVSNSDILAANLGPQKTNGNGFENGRSGGFSLVTPALPLPIQPGPRGRPIVTGQEYGTSGTENFGGYIRREDFNPELDNFVTAVRIYDKMRKGDAQIKAMLSVLKLPLRGATWTCLPAEGGDTVDQAIADYINGCLFDDDAMEFSWDFCADAETEILTKSGWKRHEDLLVGEPVLTLNTETLQSEWQAVESVHRFPGVRPMRRLASRAHDSLTTADHRWFVRNLNPRGDDHRWTVTKDLSGSDAIFRAAPCADVPCEATFADAFVELVAWFTTEGGWNGAGAEIWQKNEPQRTHIAECLRRLYGDEVESLRAVERDGHWNPTSAAWTQNTVKSGTRYEIDRFSLNKVITEQLRAICDDKKAVSLEFVYQLTRAQLELFIDTAMAGDGHTTPTSYAVLSQKEESRLHAFELAAILLGRSVSRRETVHDTAFATAHRMFRLGISNRSEHNVIASIRAGEKRGENTDEFIDEWVTYDGTVWCPKTPNSTWFARRNGKSYFTGNTLRHILLQLDMGFSVLEKSWKVDDTGAFRLLRLAPRLPKTVRQWHVNRNGRLQAIVQYAPVPISTSYPETMPVRGGVRELPGGVLDAGAAVSPVRYTTTVSFQYLTIPAEYLSVFTLDREGDNYEGVAILRSIYRNWFYKDQAYHAEGVRINRYGVGTPVASLTPEHTLSQDELDQLKETLKNLKSNEAAYLIAPPGVSYDLMPKAGSATAGSGADHWIDHHDQQIARNVLAGFLTLGNDPHGTLGFGSRLTDMFISSLNGIAAGICADLKHQVVRQLCSLNFDMTKRKYPRVTCRDLEQVDLGNLVSTLAVLANTWIKPDDNTEVLLRKLLQLPPLSHTDTRKAAKDEQKKAAEQGAAGGNQLGPGMTGGEQKAAASGKPPHIASPAPTDAPASTREPGLSHQPAQQTLELGE